MRAERTHLRNLSNRAKAEEEYDGEIKEYEVATSAAKAHRCSRVKLATTYVCNAAAALSSPPSSAVLTLVSILRTTNAVFPQHALVVSIHILYDIYIYIYNIYTHIQNKYKYIKHTYIPYNIYKDTTSACCGKTVLVVRKMDTGVNTAEEGCEERAAAALQA